MPEYIDVSEATSIIEKKQKELCPTGRWSRNAVYGTDRETFDMWQEIIDCLNSTEPADVAPVVHGRWEPCFEDWRKEIDGDRCSACGFEHYGNCISNYNYCPNCGAKMDLGD